MNSSTLWKSLGSGLLYAGAAIGVSHVVQSTRAGALYGYDLIAVVLIVNLLKYPFMEAGVRYQFSTGNSLIKGYKDLHKVCLWFFMIQTVLLMFIIQAAVTIVTSGLLLGITNIQLPVWLTSTIISLICAFILIKGHYELLKNTTKWIVITLSIATVVAVLYTLGLDNPAGVELKGFDIGNSKDILFLVALMGWMPAPLETSIWQSVWRENETQNDRKSAFIDFHFGYWLTAIISVCFIILGSRIFFLGSEPLAQGGIAFSTQIVALYTDVIGSWSWPIIAFATFATMFSTTLTVLDANPRVFSASLKELGISSSKYLYAGMIFLCIAGSVMIPVFFKKNMTDMVDFATTVSFVTAPIYAILNYIIIHKSLKPEDRPGIFNHAISILGLIFLIAFALYYIYL